MQEKIKLFVAAQPENIVVGKQTQKSIDFAQEIFKKNSECMFKDYSQTQLRREKAPREVEFEDYYFGEKTILNFYPYSF